MELELVSIKDSSQGCRGNGQQEWWYCLIIQIGYDYHRAGVPQSWSRARWLLWSHTGGVWFGSSEGALPFLVQWNWLKISCFNFHKWDSKWHVICCGSKRVSLRCYLSSWVSPPWCFTQDCLVLSSLKACGKCSSMKTGRLQCCNLMAHASSEQYTFLLFLGLPHRASWTVEKQSEDFPRCCFYFSNFILYSTLSRGSGLNSFSASQVLWSTDSSWISLCCHCDLLQ